MKVARIINIIEKYQTYSANMQRYKNALFWQEMQTGETENTQKLRMRIEQEEDTFEKFKNEEV